MPAVFELSYVNVFLVMSKASLITSPLARTYELRTLTELGPRPYMRAL